MKPLKALLLFPYLVCLSQIFVEQSIAFEVSDNLNESTVTETLKNVELELKRQPLRLEKLDEYLIALPRISAWSRECEKSADKQLAGINANLSILGDASKEESAQVTSKRNSLLQEKAQTEARQTTCRVFSLRSEEAITNINAVKQAILKKQLLEKGPNFFELLFDSWRYPAKWLDASKIFVRESSGLDHLSLLELVLFVMVLGGATGIGLYLKHLLKRQMEQRKAEQKPLGSYSLALAFTLKRYLPALLGSVSAALYMYAVTREIAPTPFISIVFYGLPFILVLMTLIHYFLRASLETGAVGIEKEAVAKLLARRLKVLVALIFTGYLIFSTIFAHSLQESVLLLTRTIYASVIVLNLIWILWLFGRFNRATGRLLFRFTVTTLFTVALLAEFFGYRNLATYFFIVLVGTLVSLGLFNALSNYTRDIMEGLEYGKGGWQKKIHSLVGVESTEPLPGMVWIRFIVNLIIWAGFLFSLMVVWQVPDSYFRLFAENVASGIKIGSFEIYPFQVIEAILVLVLLLTLNSWFQKRLKQQWLSKISLERGARESIVAITGYVGLAIAFIIALGVAGMDFSKLAIIAGALSVGIGFGLQNIVNNFISGLILLFERPVKTGDWVIVGSVEGYVKKISIRSTQIQTFDRADIIVPNSELISGNVTNLMLHDMRGRIRVPVGVAYGSDTEKVKNILLAIANQHPEVIVGGHPDPEPKVMFMGFGDSSLNFELRCYIKNIDSRLTTISDINFAIDSEFRKQGIEIPFPQRDVHVRDVPPKSLEKISSEQDGQNRE